MKVNFFWFRRDLRLEDNTGLFHASKAELPIVPLFIFDSNILERLEDKRDSRVTFIYDTLHNLKTKIKDIGGDLLVKYGDPESVWAELVKENDIHSVFANRDYEPYALERDNRIKSLLVSKGIDYIDYKDHIILEGHEILKNDGKPYTVFTPYSKKWKKKIGNFTSSPFLQSYPTTEFESSFHKGSTNLEMPTLKDIGFQRSMINIPNVSVAKGLIRNYDQTRDYPSLNGTSKLGVHFRFGTISIREKARKAYQLNQTYLNELIWRDFYSSILQNFPHVAEEPFRAKYRNIEWRNDENEFRAWTEGKTGYPIVDAGMRELNRTGYMHNRVRMITASFLTKHLLVDWRWGEAYFAGKLLDFDLASNNGGWQWAAGCGTDAAPYFRIFNPITQQKKFDPEFKYIKANVPEFGSDSYPEPIVDHKMARERCLNVYKSALSKN